MSVRNAIALFLALSSFAFLAGCGSSGNNIVIGQAPPSGAFSDSNLKGTYVFSVSGTDLVSQGAYVATGTIIANGSGGITGGTLDMNDTAFSGAVIAAPINSNGNYNVGKDGRGSFTINLPSADNPFGQPLTFDFVLQNSFQGLVTEFDGNATGSGTLDLQTASTTPAGSYAFSLSGSTYALSTFATVGNFTLTGSSISAGLEDFNSAGAAFTNGSAGYPLSGTVVAGGSASSLSTLSTSSSFGTSGSLSFDVYPIDSTHLKFIEVDSYATLSGDAFTEAATVPSGNLVFTLSGLVPGGTPFAAGGLMVTSGGSIGTGSTEDYNDGGSEVSTPGSPLPYSGSYSGANGRFAVSLSGFFPATISAFVAYPSSGGMFLLETDGTGGTTTGAAYAQNSSASFAPANGYGLNFTGVGGSGEVDDIDEFTAAASGSSCIESTSSGNTTVTSNTIIGVVDENSLSNGPTLGQSLCGSYGSIDTSGRLSISYSANTVLGGLTGTAYTVDGTTFPFIEVDSGQVSTGLFVLQDATATSPSLAKPHSMFVPHPIVQPRAAKQKQK